MPLLKKRIVYKPFEYVWAHEAWLKQHNAHWLHTEIPMQSDIKDWQINLSKYEKSVVEQILKGFAQTEVFVNDYWSGYVTKWFPVPEIKMMASAFGDFETIHANAYVYLNESLGLDDFEAFLEDKEVMDKLEPLIEIDPDENDLMNIARSLAIFSACAEGIQLFSSFAILLSFKKKNMLKGISQQMQFSVRDESLHSEMGCKLFRTLIDENPDLWTDELKQSIYKAVDYAVESEVAFIEKVFSEGDLESIKKSQLINFIYDRANRKLKEVMLESVYKIDELLLSEMQWFYIAVSGEQQTDFFANRETGYSKASGDWNNDDVFNF